MGKPELRDDFRRSLRDLDAIRINPVTIPEEYGIKYLPNLLDTYYNKVREEKNAALKEEWRLNNLKECLEKGLLTF